jgi:hypothetical protein
MKRIGVFAVLIGIIGILSFHGASSTTARSSGSPSFNSVPGFNAVGGPPILAGDSPCTPPPAGCIAPPAGLVGWWSGDGDAKDIQGNNNASLQGGVTFAAGKVGEAFDFRSTPIGRVTVPDDTSFNVQQFTIDAWIKTAPLSRGALVAAKSARTGLSGYELSVHPSGVLRFGLNGEEGGARVIGSINVTDNSFHHVAATYDGSSLKVYVDGNLDAQTPVTVTITYPLESPFQIGNR